MGENEAKIAKIRQFLEDFRDFAFDIDEIKELEKSLFEPPYRSEKIQGMLLDVIAEVGGLMEEIEIALAEDTDNDTD